MPVEALAELANVKVLVKMIHDAQILLRGDGAHALITDLGLKYSQDLSSRILITKGNRIRPHTTIWEANASQV